MLKRFWQRPKPNLPTSNMSEKKLPLAVVTGGAHGIGEFAVRKFAGMGFSVAILDVANERGNALASELSSCPVRFHECDVSDAEKVEQVSNLTRDEFGEPSILVTSAALIPNSESIMEMDLKAHQRMWDVNYNGTIHACRSFGKQMIVNGGGSIVTLGSVHSLLPMPFPAYNPGKAAIARLTQLLAAELGRYTIRVNSVAPTYVMTSELQARIDRWPNDLGKILGVHALKILPTPSDIAEAIAFLCSPAARAITGILLPVDSGWAASVSYMTYAGGVPWEKAS